MRTVGQSEKQTQENVIEFFEQVLGYDYLGNWQHRPNNSNIEKELLTKWLKRQEYSDEIIQKVLSQLEREADLSGSKILYEVNSKIYERLRYGMRIRPSVGEKHTTIQLIDWKDPRNNHFGIAEEVTIEAENTKRPDLVLYVNGIALGVIELKSSRVSLTEGIRQNLDNQKEMFIRKFFTTVQLLMAGNESEGLSYGVIETPEKYWLRWKETETDPDTTDNPLFTALRHLCNRERLLEILHNFIVFDAGVKKICRHNQFFGVKAAQAYLKREEGGIIWHTQGSGKSLTMVWLARWIREELKGRVLIITDRTELDQQIEMVFKGVNENIYRTQSGDDLGRVLSETKESLICSLIQKMRTSDELTDEDVDTYIDQIQQTLPDKFQPSGTFFVFVDECHRTQSGKLHKAMKKLLPEAVSIGFTGTPLLKNDKPQSREIFGDYIHIYQYDEAVRDEVVLDLRYEARDIDQRITAQTKIDQFFDIKTRGLTDIAKAQLKKRWGTMQKVYSAEDRLRQIVADIHFDMIRYPRLESGRGNALLVSDSIHSTCRFFDLFQQTELKGKCAIVTSYKPTPDAIKGEETGEGLTEALLKNTTYRKMLAAHFNEPEDTAARKFELFERQVKERFVKKPGQMKLLIVVDKLLTGFDAPSATYLYIDKQMKDHQLFQAICRINRLDGEDKEYGYIIDYKDLFRSLDKAMKDYTGGAFANYDPDDIKDLLKNRLQQGKERLEETREHIKELCEFPDLSSEPEAHLHHFCAQDSGNAEQLKANKHKRVMLYKQTRAFLRAYANLANEMGDAGYSTDEAQTIKAEVDHYEKIRQEVQLASGDYVDLKAYEPAMRHLLDTYIRAEETQTLSTFEDMTLVQLIVARGEAAVELLPESIQKSDEMTAETIENNVRQVIVQKMPDDPNHYGSMSEVLDALIQKRREAAMAYEAYLSEIVTLTKKIVQPETHVSYPTELTTKAQQVLFGNIQDFIVSDDYTLDAADKVRIALALDHAILEARWDDWKGDTMKERGIRQAIKQVVTTEVAPDAVDIDALFELVKNQDEY